MTVYGYFFLFAAIWAVGYTILKADKRERLPAVSVIPFGVGMFGTIILGAIIVMRLLMAA